MLFKHPAKLKNLFAAIMVALPAAAHAQDGLPPAVMENKLAIAILIFVYLLPAWIAWSRKHPSKGSIILINVLLGLTGIGWIVALIWACGSTKQNVVIVPASDSQNAPVINSAANKTVAERIGDLKAMLDNGAINQSEFDRLKADVLKSIS